MHSRLPHETTEISSHRTSEGTVTYLRCDCGAWEVRTQAMVVCAASTGAPSSA